MSDTLPLGEPLDWHPVQIPGREALRGPRILIRPVDPDADAAALYAVSHPPGGDPAIWTYLFDGPYASADELRERLVEVSRSDDPLFMTLARLPHEDPEGIASYLRITPEHGTIEIGNIWFGEALKRTAAATEAIYLLIRHAFDDLGYRRMEWKCNALNAASRLAAERFGFTFEGVFRHHMVVKGRNRDTAWYAIVESDWPRIRGAFEQWLAPENFDQAGNQLRRLDDILT